MTRTPWAASARSLASALLLAGSASVACAQATPPGRAAEQAARARQDGRYNDAIRLAREALGTDSADALGARTLLRSLLDVGRLGEVLEAGEALRRSAAGRGVAASGVDLLLGEAWAARGAAAQAREAFTRATGGRDSLTARLQLAVLDLEAGRQDEALRAFDRFIDAYNAGRGTLRPDELRAVAIACRYLGRRDPQLYKDALAAYDQAIARDSSNLDLRAELGALFVEKYNGDDARPLLEGVLRVNPRHPGALVAMARLVQLGGAGDAAAFVRRALEVNPGHAEGRALAAQVLLDVERYDDAAREAIRGLVNDSGAPAPLVALAAARWLSRDSANFQRALGRAHARLPGSAYAEVTLADVAARNRLYREAVRFAADGVAREPSSPRAHALLGINQLRIGQIAEGRLALQRAFELDPYDPQSFNTLELLDDFAEYAELRSDRFTLVAEKKDAELLALYVRPLAEEAYDSLAARYGYRPAGPVRIELFRSHEDFSVRTVGLAGLGALGVCFGDVLAMDSPAARKVGEFNWGSTLWHELAHTFTLGATDNRVPRWLSEGLSVLEERRARASWGTDVSPEFLAAYAGGRLAPPSRLNDGFMRPRYAGEVQLTYYLASLVAEWIEQERGIAGIRALLDAYRRGATSTAAIGQALGRTMEQLDSDFDRWLRIRFARELTAVVPRTGDAREGIPAWEGPFAEAMRSAAALAERQQWDAAVRELEKAKVLLPSYAGEDSPYRTLARIHVTRGDSAAALRELAALTSRNELAYEANLELASLAVARRDSATALAALQRALYISPFDVAVHHSLAAMAAAARRHPLAVRERQAILALNPSDRVEALYQLARAHADAGDVPAARREVLRALDLAPHYEKAQALLLALPGRRP